MYVYLFSTSTGPPRALTLTSTPPYVSHTFTSYTYIHFQTSERHQQNFSCRLRKQTYPHFANPSKSATQRQSTGFCMSSLFSELPHTRFTIKKNNIYQRQSRQSQTPETETETHIKREKRQPLNPFSWVPNLRCLRITTMSLLSLLPSQRASLTVFQHTVRIDVDLRYDYINKSSAPEYTYTRNLFTVKFATLHMGGGRVLVGLVGYTCVGALIFF